MDLYTLVAVGFRSGRPDELSTSFPRGNWETRRHDLPHGEKVPYTVGRKFPVVY